MKLKQGPQTILVSLIAISVVIFMCQGSAWAWVDVLLKGAFYSTLSESAGKATGKKGKSRTTDFLIGGVEGMALSDYGSGYRSKAPGGFEASSVVREQSKSQSKKKSLKYLRAGEGLKLRPANTEQESAKGLGLKRSRKKAISATKKIATPKIIHITKGSFRKVSFESQK